MTQHFSVSIQQSLTPSILASTRSDFFITFSLLFIFAQAAYLVGIADPNSEAGTQGLVDQTQFARANQAIQMACQSLVDPSSNQTQVVAFCSEDRRSFGVV